MNCQSSVFDKVGTIHCLGGYFLTCLLFRAAFYLHYKTDTAYVLH